MTTEFEAGKAAFLQGKSEKDNPYICGVTKLGSPKFLNYEAGSDWALGYNSAKPARVASKKEVEAAASVDVARFRRKSNRHYS